MGPVGKTVPSNAVDAGSIPGWRAKISQPKIQNIKQKQCCNIYNKDFKNGAHQKTNKLSYDTNTIIFLFYRL